MIYVDFRERELILALKKSKIEFVTKSLLIGDVIVGDFIFELKKGSDFISSIYDLRLFFQTSKMKNTEKKKCLIIYDLKNIYKNVRNRNTINGVITSLLLRGIQVIPLENVNDIVYVLNRIDKRDSRSIDINEINYCAIPKFKNDLQRKITGLSCAESISLKKSRILLDKYGSIMEIGKNIDSISEIHGFGNKITENIRKFLF